MSVDWINLVPTEIGFIPSPEDEKSAIEAFREIAPDAVEISSFHSETVAFFDCGENFVSIKCPYCQEHLETGWWGKAMTEDYSPEHGFQMREYELPCCAKQCTLAALSYDMHQAFGRFALRGQDCNIGSLSPAHLETLSRIMKGRFTVIYQHL